MVFVVYVHLYCLAYIMNYITLKRFCCKELIYLSAVAF